MFGLSIFADEFRIDNDIAVVHIKRQQWMTDDSIWLKVKNELRDKFDKFCVQQIKHYAQEAIRKADNVDKLIETGRLKSSYHSGVIDDIAGISESITIASGGGGAGGHAYYNGNGGSNVGYYHQEPYRNFQNQIDFEPLAANIGGYQLVLARRVKYYPGWRVIFKELATGMSWQDNFNTYAEARAAFDRHRRLLECEINL